MSVARESLVRALHEMIDFEEVAVAFLAEVESYDLSMFSKSQQKQIKRYLGQLKEDSHEHEREIKNLIHRLSDAKDTA